jgi:hypothetical protein
MDVKELKIDRTKLKKISTYAKERGLTVQRIYQLAKEGSVKIIEIDKVKFVYN